MSERSDTVRGAPPAGATRQRRRRRSLTPAQLRRLGLAVLGGILLTLSTIATFGYLPRYQLPGEPILDNADFRAGFRDWHPVGLVTLDEVELGLVILQNLAPDRITYLRRVIPLPPGRTHVKLSADVATYGVHGGEEAWQTARIYLVQEDPDGRYLWNQPHQLISLVGTTSRQHYAAVFEVPGLSPAVRLGIELPYATGRLEVANLQLEVVEERPVFRLVASVLVAGWCLLVAWIGMRLFGGIRSVTVRAWLLGALAVLGAGLFMPAFLRQHLIDGLASGFGLRLPDPDAFGHALVFGLLALLVRIGRHRDPLLLHLSCWLLAGAATETLQLLTADRNPEAADWLMNALGAAAGLVLAETSLWVQRALEAARQRARQKDTRVLEARLARDPFARHPKDG